MWVKESKNEIGIRGIKRKKEVVSVGRKRLLFNVKAPPFTS